MNTLQIVHALKDVPSFQGVYPSDLLPKNVNSGSYIINFDEHTEPGSHWVGVYFYKNFVTSFYFDSYGLFPPLTSIHTFIKQHSITWNYSHRQLQGLTSNTCGYYACLFALFMDKGYSPMEYINQFTLQPDVQVKQLFHHYLGPLCNTRGGQTCLALRKGM